MEPLYPAFGVSAIYFVPTNIATYLAIYSSYISDSIVHILLDHVYSDLHHHLLDHQHEELLQQVHQCEVHHLCLFVDHQPVIIKVEEMVLHICYYIDKCMDLGKRYHNVMYYHQTW